MMEGENKLFQRTFQLRIRQRVNHARIETFSSLKINQMGFNHLAFQTESGWLSPPSIQQKKIKIDR